jgi:hypothetical protein
VLGAAITIGVLFLPGMREHDQMHVPPVSDDPTALVEAPV